MAAQVVKFAAGYKPVALAFELLHQPNLLLGVADDCDLRYLVCTELSMNQVVQDINNALDGDKFLVSNFVGTVQSCVDFGTSVGFSPSLLLFLTTSPHKLRHKLLEEGLGVTETNAALKSLITFKNRMDSIIQHYGQHVCQVVDIAQSENDKRVELNALFQQWILLEAEERREKEENDLAIWVKEVREREEDEMLKTYVGFVDEDKKGSSGDSSDAENRGSYDYNRDFINSEADEVVDFINSEADEVVDDWKEYSDWNDTDGQSD